MLLVAVVGMGTAQRPSTGSICDYYAIRRFGENSSDTQFMLMQSIVALAFGGGASLRNASDDSTGILNPGLFNGSVINLRPWFDGSSMFHASSYRDRVIYSVCRSHDELEQPSHRNRLVGRWSARTIDGLPQRHYRYGGLEYQQK